VAKNSVFSDLFREKSEATVAHLLSNKSEYPNIVKLFDD